MNLTPNERIELCLFGICGEVGEVIDLYKKERFHKVEIPAESYEKEIGDVAWYVANLCTETGEKFAPNERRLKSLESATVEAKALIESMFIQAANFGRIDIEWMVSMLFVLPARLGLRPFEQILDMNIAKLKARYPDGFSTEASVERRDEL